MAVSITKKLTSEDLHNAYTAYKEGRITETEFVMALQLPNHIAIQLSRYNADNLTLQSASVGLMDDFHSWNAPIPSVSIDVANKSALNELSFKNAPDIKGTQDVVSITLSYHNHTLAAIMQKLKQIFKPSTFDEHVKVIEDTPRKWAIHTSEQYFYTVHGIVEDVCHDYRTVFRAADTGNPDWDLFCSAT
jgi:hypothetical protein